VVDHRYVDIKSIAHRIGAEAVSLLFPPTCRVCRVRVSAPVMLCSSCWPKVRFLDRPWCEVLGTPFDYDPGEGAVSAAALADPPAFDRARSAVSYTGIAGQLVHQLKYGDRTELAPWMAIWMQRAGAELFREGQLVVPVPLHWRRFLDRRYNQSAELARALAAAKGMEFAPQILVRRKKTRQQVGLGQRERTENVRAAFAVPDAMRGAVRDARILLIDDVYTTGATVSSAAKALKRAGAAGVDVLTFARVIPGDFEAGDFRSDIEDLI
jgi:ComF family protein